MRVVLDTTVLVAALRSSTGASNLLLRAALEQRYTLLLSVPLVLEYEAVLTREKHLIRSGLNVHEIGVLLDSLVQVAEPIRFMFHWRPLLSDPDDDMVLETVVNGSADTLVTFNVRDFQEITPRFGAQVLMPKQALQVGGML